MGNFDMIKKIKAFDYTLLIMVSIISIFGIIVIGSATHIQTHGDSRTQDLQRMWFLTGIIILIIMSFINYRFIAKFYILIYSINLLLLVLVYIRGPLPGSNVARWLIIGPVSIQPSEFAKIFMIIFLAGYIDKNNEKINNPIILLSVLALSAIPTVLILLQPSLSASLVIIVITLALLFVGQVDYKYVYKAAIISLPVAILLLIDIMREQHIVVDILLKEYQIVRIRDLFLRNPNSQTRVQTDHSVAAIGSGQLTGQGLHQGTMNQLEFLIEAENDFIFAVIGEEFGFIGSTILILLMLGVVLRCTYTASRADDLLGKLIATGVATLLAFQIFINIGVATDIVPNTGIALPFVSYGGSAMWVNMACIGLVINVGMNKKKSIFEE
jgi:rod shape determining protein RodA